jgi:hypothetical protein
MEGFVRFLEDGVVMAPQLRLVPPAPGGNAVPTYVVSRTELVEPGRPYVIAALADPLLAEDYRYAEAEVYSPAEMRADGRLSAALDAWQAGDLDLFRRDREAHERVEASYRASVLRAAQRHPSMLAR